MSCEVRAPTKVPVTVHGKKQNGKVDFGHKWQGADGEWNDGDIILAHNSGEHEIVFEVDPNSPKRLRFVDNADDAIWVSVGRCPTGKCNEGSQITPIAVEADGTRLRVHNANKGDPVDLHYALRFKRSLPWLKPRVYDPIIKNGGGTTT